MKYLTMEPLQQIEELRHLAGANSISTGRRKIVDPVRRVFDSGVYWGRLSWHAAVPLLEMGVKEEDIEQWVQLPSLQNTTGRSITSIKSLIAYYKEVRHHPINWHMVEAILQAQVHEQRGESPLAPGPLTQGEWPPGVVAELLRQGRFKVYPKDTFYKHEQWEDAHFQLPPRREGLV